MRACMRVHVRVSFAKGDAFITSVFCRSYVPTNTTLGAATSGLENMHVTDGGGGCSRSTGETKRISHYTQPP